ncbi:eyes absent homolog 3 isoform X6 [Ambystoma mexicanum]|uniref:eyes absent homolog 3 isoform X6 n=1 Tax=Ambystoma mexicanum TaxID=8296 RepID=UPI0037E7CBA1
MEDMQDLSEHPMKKARMQEPGDTNLSRVSKDEAGNQKPESSGLGPNHSIASEILTNTDYIPRTSSDYTSQIYSAKQYAHILSLPVTETMSAYSGQTPFQALQSSPPYTVYPQESQTYGLPPFAGSVNTDTISTSAVLNTTAPTVATVSHQDYPTYTILGQSQYEQCYPGSCFSTTTPSHTITESNTLPTASFQTGKTNVGMPIMRTSRLPSDDSATSLHLTETASKELDEQSKKAMQLKNRTKVKKSDATTAQDNELERIFLWDLDETIIIFHSLLTGSYAQKYGKDPTIVVSSGLAMEEMIFEVADTHLFFNDLEECDQVHVEDVASDDNGQDLSNYNFSTDDFNSSGSSSGHGSSAGVQGGVDWMRKLAFRYRKVKEIYDHYKSNAGGLLSPQRRDTLQRLRSDIETLTDAWLGTALKCLLLIQSRKNCVNVLITTTQLVPALAKVLLYGLGEVFPIQNIYSATKIGKESCFERIVTRFGKKVTYVVIGDGRDEEIAAKQHNMPFWRIANHSDLVSLHQALELDFL